MDEADNRPPIIGTDPALKVDPRTILESTADSVFVLDAEWRFTYVNRRAARQIRGGRDLQGRLLWEAFPEAEEYGFASAFRRTMAERIATRHDEWYGPQQRWLEANAYPLEDGGVVVFLRDITAERRVQAALEQRNASLEARIEARSRELEETVQALRLSRERLSVLFEHSPLCLAVLIRRHDGIFAFERANPVLGRAFEHKPELVGGQTTALFFPEPLAAELARNLKICVETAVRVEFETATPTATGRRSLHIILVRLPDEHDQRPRVLMTAMDVTDIRRAESQLMQAQRLEAIGQLTGGVAHDFNNLLTAIMGSLELLAKRVSDERQRRYIETANSAARRGASLTQQLLAYARKQHLAPKPVDLTEAVHGMEEMLRRSLGGLITIEIRMPPELWQAYADPTQFELVVLNLAINARDAMPLGGTLWIEARNMPHGSSRWPAELRAGDYVCLSVRDSGKGMSPEVLARAFEPFFTTKEVGKGSGLGLAQTYGFAQQLGGTVRIDSTVDVGTCVEVILPRAQAETAGEQGISEPEGSRAKHSPVALMLVDDDDEVRSVAATLLREAGYSVSDYSAGSDALAALAAGARAEVLLVDVAMPSMSGIELARRARERHPSMPIVFLTGNADPDVVDNLAGPVLNKPFALKDLLRTVEEAVGPLPLHEGQGTLPHRAG